jgi:hypothetical protein
MQKPSAVRSLLTLQERLKPDVLFLSEAYLGRAKAENWRKRLQFDEMLVSESDGRSGGLVMFWNKETNVTSFEIDTNFIDIRIDEQSGAAWRFTGFYGDPSAQNKQLMWDYIRNLSTMVDLPWVMIGDFNEIMYSHEKEGEALDPNGA